MSVKTKKLRDCCTTGRVFIFLLLILPALSSFSQVAVDDFVKINNAYKKYPRLSMKIKYEVFKNHDTKTVVQEETGEIKQNGILRYTRIGKMETIHNNDYYLIADHEEMTIALLGQKSDDEPISPVDPFNLANLEKIINQCTKTEFNKENSSQNSYLLSFPYSEFSQVKIVFNKKTFLIEKTTLYYNQPQNLEEKEDGLKEPPRIEITYYDIGIDPNFTGTDFTHEKFLEKKSGKYYCRQPFGNYKLMVHLLNNL